MTQKFFLKITLNLDISIVFKYLWQLWQFLFVPTFKNAKVAVCCISMYKPKVVTVTARVYRKF